MFIWFSKGVNLSDIKNNWGFPDLNFDPEVPIDRSWVLDQFEIPLPGGSEIFDQAAERLMRYDFYPDRTMVFDSDFLDAGRWMQAGDRILQRIRIIPGVLDVLTMTRVTQIVIQEGRRGFTYATTQQHYEMGEWSATISLRRDQSCSLLIQSVSKPGHRIPPYARPYARNIQKRAHHAGDQFLFRKVEGSDPAQWRGRMKWYLVTMEFSWEEWRRQVQPGFQIYVKTPKPITHDKRLRRPPRLMDLSTKIFQITIRQRQTQ